MRRRELVERDEGLRGVAPIEGGAGAGDAGLDDGGDCAYV